MNPRLTVSAFVRSEKRGAKELETHPCCLGSAHLLSGPVPSPAPCSHSEHHGWKLDGGLPGPIRASKAGGTSRNQVTAPRALER